MAQGRAYGVEVETEALLRLRPLMRHVRERRLAPAGPPGGFVSRRRGNGLEPVEVRRFSDGDDMRHIDRNVTARTGKPHVRTFHEERERALLLIADFRPSMLWGTRRALRSVAAAEALALIGWRAADDGGRVGLLALGGARPVVVAPRARARGMLAVIGGLAEAHRDALALQRAGRSPDMDLAAGLELAANIAPAGAAALIATGLDRPGPRFAPIAAALRRKSRLAALLIRDGFESAAPSGEYRFARLGGGDGEETELGVVSGAADADRGRAELLARAGVPCLRVDAGHDAETMARTLDLGAFGDG